jgi:hypothetical protein
VATRTEDTATTAHITSTAGSSHEPVGR